MKHRVMSFATGIWWLQQQGKSWAGTAGTGLPWDQPMTTISTALYGTPAHAILTAVIVFAGIAWAFTDRAPRCA